jgi:hypothetical protein
MVNFVLYVPYETYGNQEKSLEIIAKFIYYKDVALVRQQREILKEDRNT